MNHQFTYFVITILVIQYTIADQNVTLTKDSIENEQQTKLDNERLYRFNNRFESMRRCHQLPTSPCECLWDLKHLTKLVGDNRPSSSSSSSSSSLSLDEATNSDSSTYADQVDHRGKDDGQFQRQRRRLSTVMVVNVLRLGAIGFDSNEHTTQWIKCVPSENICQLTNGLQSNVNTSYEDNRREILSMLMPNMVKRRSANGHTKANKSTIKLSNEENGDNKPNEPVDHDHDDHPTQTPHSSTMDMFNSIELLTDIEELLRKLSRQLVIDTVNAENRDEIEKKKTNIKCFDREDLFDDLRQQPFEQRRKRRSSLSELVNERNKSDNHHHQHNHTQPFSIDSKENDSENLNWLYIEYLTTAIVDRLASGQCIELFESKFLRDIIHRYGSRVSKIRNLSRDAIRIDANGDQHDHNHHHHHHSIPSIPNEPSNKSTLLHINRDGFAQLLNDLHIGGLIENDQKQSPDNHHHNSNQQLFSEESRTTTETRGYRSISTSIPIASNHNHIGHHHKHSRRRYNRRLPNKSSSCLDYQYYLNRQGINANDIDTDGTSKGLTEDDLRQLSPIFIQQILSGACEQLEPREYVERMANPSNTFESSEPTIIPISSHAPLKNDNELWQVYLFSTIAVFIISVSSICGVLLMPFIKSRFYPHLINLLIGLAFGTMAGDALFHLLPTVLGLHSHSDHEAEHDHDHEHEHEHGNETNILHEHEHGHDHNYLMYMFAVLATTYVLFLFEVISNFFTEKRGGHHHHHHHHHHDHSHSHKKSFVFDADHGKEEFKYISSVPVLNSISKNNKEQHSNYSSSVTLNSTLTSNIPSDLEQSNNENEMYKMSPQSISTSNEMISTPNEKENVPVLGPLTSLALIITIGDAIHNFLDGIAIGIAFSSSIASGISTSIAVFCHELPHEFGDFAVLLSTGLSVSKAAIINFISALTAFIGLYVGILVGNNEIANRWALAICAGLFLYVAFVDMLPELKEMPSTLNGNLEWFISLIMKNIGIIVGVAFMVALSQFEHLLKFA